jgi:glycosyltransferase involved in cell wall biosynthesis
MNQEMVEFFVPKLTAGEFVDLLRLADKAVEECGKYSGNGAIFGLMNDTTISRAYKMLALLLNRTWRAASQKNDMLGRTTILKELVSLRERLACASLLYAADPLVSYYDPVLAKSDEHPTIDEAIKKVYEIAVGRFPVPEEINIWKNNFSNGLPFHEFFVLMRSGEEAKRYKQIQDVLSEGSDGEFVQIAFELVLSRGAAAWEIEHWLRRMEESNVTRSTVIASLFDSAKEFFIIQTDARPHDGLSCGIMGTAKTVTVSDWERQAQGLPNSPSKTHPVRTVKHFDIKGEARVLVSALASMYRGGDFIEQFMDNITNQDGFDEYCELVIVDADSPEDEYKTIKRYLGQHKNINYIRCNYRIGIYDAWNVAAKAARGQYLTNTNMDDLRRHDSFMVQAAMLDKLSFVDVVYQDLYYTFDPRLSFEEIVPFGLRTTLPVITPHNMIKFNSPHNAPMWRKRLHEDLGYFDTHYKSAGDYEFWMRCLAAGKKFYKINDPHVVYYQNPKGLSTRPDTRGVAESMEIHKIYCRKLIQADVVMPREEFILKLDPARTSTVGNTKDRYTLVQQALRNAARNRKYPAVQGAKS